MSRNDIHKSFTTQPVSAVVRATGESVPVEEVLRAIERDVDLVTSMVEYHLACDDALLDDLSSMLADEKTARLKCNKIGDYLGVRLPRELTAEWKSGSSRLENMFRDRLIREAKSWLDRCSVARGTTDKPTKGVYRRLARMTRPTALVRQMNLSAADGQYAKVTNDPMADGEIVLDVVISGTWYTLVLPFDNERFPGASGVTLPNVRVENGRVIFTFTARYEYTYTRFSPDYVVGVDVGVSNYATVVVIRAEDGQIVHATDLSRRVHSLANSIRASEEQKKNLKKLGREEEARFHREAASRKKRELAILAAQEIAYIAYTWGNALVAVEDLSWIVNTMSNGRWNRGVLVDWIEHYVELNGGRVFEVSPYRTSQECHFCRGQVTFDGWHTAVCSHCETRMNRDVNAAANIASRLVEKGTWGKACATREKAKKVTSQQVRRSPKTRDTLKRPGTRRDKHAPTPARGSSPTKKRSVIRGEGVISEERTAIGMDDRTVVADTRVKHTSGETFGLHDDPTRHRPGA